jgi:hypothetical protein
MESAYPSYNSNKDASVVCDPHDEYCQRFCMGPNPYEAADEEAGSGVRRLRRADADASGSGDGAPYQANGARGLDKHANPYGLYAKNSRNRFMTTNHDRGNCYDFDDAGDTACDMKRVQKVALVNYNATEAKPSWSDLSAEQLAAATALGGADASWNAATDKKAFAGVKALKWAGLTTNQQEQLALFGWTQNLWDSTSQYPYPTERMPLVVDDLIIISSKPANGPWAAEDKWMYGSVDDQVGYFPVAWDFPYSTLAEDTAIVGSESATAEDKRNEVSKKLEEVGRLFGSLGSKAKAAAEAAFGFGGRDDWDTRKHYYADDENTAEEERVKTSFVYTDCKPGRIFASPYF